MVVMYCIRSIPEFIDWFNSLTAKTQAQIQARFFRITEYGHFGDAKKIGVSLAELRWKSGIRVYFSILKNEEGNLIVLLIGGNKNSQGMDILKAKKLLNEVSLEKFE